MRHLTRNIQKVISNTYNYSTGKWPKQVLSAIQPTGNIHLGNYLGAVKKWVDLQHSEENTVIFGIADLHSITIPQDPQELQKNILTTVATLLACGIDPKKSILFQQSSVIHHSQLCWILSTMTTMARLAHLPQYKEKSKLFKDIPVGIFLYPILQASDIMLYRATHIPVGDDQIQHVILVNDIIKVFNGRFGETFPRVNPITDSHAGRIKSLHDPTKKMSKSDKNTKATISLLDKPEEILFKCKKALTDFKSGVTFEPETRPGVSNLVQIHSSLTGKTPDEVIQECAGLDTSKYKLILSEIIIEHLKPIQKKLVEYLNSTEYLVSELQVGAQKANEIAEKTMKDVNSRMGIDLLNLTLESKTVEAVY